MARFSTLYSSSKGNCIFIGCSGGSILIDAGVSAKRIEQALSDIDEDVRKIRAIFVTHEHSDHISGLNAFASRYGIRVYASGGTLSALEESGGFKRTELHEMEEGGVSQADMNITAFRTTHDCREGLGYVIETPDGRKIAVATDLGYYSDEIRKSLQGCDLVFIESNYDEKMLMNGSYPYPLKVRIASSHGHLSNSECADAVSGLVKNGSSRFVLGHLSAENNRTEIAYGASYRSLCEAGGKLGRDFTLMVAPRLSPLEKIIF